MHHALMTTEEIGAIPIRHITNKDAALVLSRTGPRPLP